MVSINGETEVCANLDKILRFINIFHLKKLLIGEWYCVFEIMRAKCKKMNEWWKKIPASSL